jgi:transposase-like protein
LSPLKLILEERKMSQKYTEGFKIQAVEKVLNRSSDISLTEIAKTLGVSRSALQRWITQSKNDQLETMSANATSLVPTMTEKEKRPQDWSLEERLKLIIKSDSLSEEECNKLCRIQGLFPHHVKEWKQQFITGSVTSSESKKQVTVKGLRNEIKELTKDLNRKNKALAETAALLVLKKKVNAIWGSNEDNSQ